MLKLFAHGIANRRRTDSIRPCLLVRSCMVGAPDAGTLFSRGAPRSATSSPRYTVSRSACWCLWPSEGPTQGTYFSVESGFISVLSGHFGLATLQQVAWVSCVVLVLTWTAFVDDHFYWSDTARRGFIRYDASHWQDDGLLRAAHAFTQNLSPDAEKLLFFCARRRFWTDFEPLISRSCRHRRQRSGGAPANSANAGGRSIGRSGQFLPTFYDREWSVLDASAEDRQIKADECVALGAPSGRPDRDVYRNARQRCSLPGTSFAISLAYPMNVNHM